MTTELVRDPASSSAATPTDSRRWLILAVVLAYQIGHLSNFIPVPGGIGVLDRTRRQPIILRDPPEHLGRHG